MGMRVIAVVAPNDKVEMLLFVLFFRTKGEFGCSFSDSGSFGERDGR
jgi:hypothetical protein